MPTLAPTEIEDWTPPEVAGESWAPPEADGSWVPPEVAGEAEPPVQSIAATAAYSFPKTFSNVATGTVGGIAKMADVGLDVVNKYTGIGKPEIFKTIGEVMDDASGYAAEMYPVDERNPITSTVAGGAAQGISLLAGGAAGKALGLGEAALTRIPLALGAAQGANQGIDTARELGVESPEAQLALGALFGGVEVATEKMMGIGNKEATNALLDRFKKPAGEMLAEAAKSVTGEGFEEILAGSAQDWLARAFATEDPSNPGFTKTGVPLPEVDPRTKEFLKKRGMEFLGGAAGGSVFAGAQVLANAGKPEAPPPSIESGESVVPEFDEDALNELDASVVQAAGIANRAEDADAQNTANELRQTTVAAVDGQPANEPEEWVDIEEGPQSGLRTAPAVEGDLLTDFQINPSTAQAVSVAATAANADAPLTAQALVDATAVAAALQPQTTQTDETSQEKGQGQEDLLAQPPSPQQGVSSAAVPSLSAPPAAGLSEEKVTGPASPIAPADGVPESGQILASTRDYEPGSEDPKEIPPQTPEEQPSTEERPESLTESEKVFASGLAKKYGMPVLPSVPAEEPYESISRFSNMLEAAADKSKDESEIAQILAASKGKPDSNRIAIAVAYNPHSSDESFAEAKSIVNPLEAEFAPDPDSYRQKMDERNKWFDARRKELRQKRNLPSSTEPSKNVLTDASIPVTGGGMETTTEEPDYADLHSYIEANHPQEAAASRYLDPLAQYKFHLAVWRSAGSPKIDTEDAPATRIEKEAAEIGEMQAKLKERASIYNAGAKDDAAELIGIKPDRLYNLPYEKWSEINKTVQAFRKEAQDAWKGSDKTLFSEIWKLYAQANPDKVAKVRESVESMLATTTTQRDATKPEQMTREAFTAKFGDPFTDEDKSTLVAAFRSPEYGIMAAREHAFLTALGYDAKKNPDTAGFWFHPDPKIGQGVESKNAPTQVEGGTFISLRALDAAKGDVYAAMQEQSDNPVPEKMTSKEKKEYLAGFNNGKADQGEIVGALPGTLDSLVRDSMRKAANAASDDRPMIRLYWKGWVEGRVDSLKPILAAAVEAYGIKLPAGYQKQGDLYVFQPETPPQPPQETTPQAAAETGVVEARSEEGAVSITQDEISDKIEETLRAPTQATKKPRVSFKTQAEEGGFRRGFQAAVQKPGEPPPPDKPGLSPKDRKYDDAWRVGWSHGQMFVRSYSQPSKKQPAPAPSAPSRESEAGAVATSPPGPSRPVVAASKSETPKAEKATTSVVEPPPLKEGLYKAKNEETRAHTIARGFIWNGEDWVHPDYPGATIYSSDVPEPKASRVREELAKLRGEQGVGVSGAAMGDARAAVVPDKTGGNQGTVTPPWFIPGRFVEWKEGVPTYKNGQIEGSRQIKRNGKIESIKDGVAEIRRTDGGFSKKTASELVDQPNHTANKPEPPVSEEPSKPPDARTQFVAEFASLFPGLPKVSSLTPQQAAAGIESILNDGKQRSQLEVALLRKTLAMYKDMVAGYGVTASYDPRLNAVVAEPGTSPSTLAHEVGHLIERTLLKSASPETQKAIRDSYERWLKSKDGGNNLTETDRARFWDYMTEEGWANPDAKYEAGERSKRYITGFKEWFADQIGRWASTNAKPVSLIDKFFSDVAAKLKQFFDRIQQRFMPDKTVADWLDQLSGPAPKPDAKPKRYEQSIEELEKLAEEFTTEIDKAKQAGRNSSFWRAKLQKARMQIQWQKDHPAKPPDTRTIANGDKVKFRQEGVLLIGTYQGVNADGTYSVLVKGEKVPRHVSARSLNENNGGAVVEGTRFSMPKSSVTPEQDAEYLAAVETGDMEKAQRMVDEKLASVGAMWHGTPSGDLRGGVTGLHVGTRRAAMEALEARIGIPADGNGWDGSREYGKTLLAGKDRINSGQFGKYRLSGFNTDAPSSDYYPTKMPSVGKSIPVDPTWKPWLRPVLVVGEMTNTRRSPISDAAANRRIERKRGAFYTNEGEDTGSVSAVLPNGDSVRVKLADPVTRDEQGNVIPLSQRFNPESSDIRFALPTGNRAMPLDKARTHVYNKLKASPRKVRVINEPSLKFRGRYDPDSSITLNSAYLGSIEELNDVLLNHEAIHDAIETSGKVREQADALLGALTEDERADIEAEILDYKDGEFSAEQVQAERQVEAIRKLTANRPDLQSAWGRLVESVSLSFKKLLGVNVSRQQAELAAARIVARGLKRLRKGKTGGRTTGGGSLYGDAKSRNNTSLTPLGVGRTSGPAGVKPGPTGEVRLGLDYLRSPNFSASPSDVTRFKQLTVSIPPKPTPEQLETWKQEHPAEYKELEAMRERVLREMGYTVGPVYHGTKGKRNGVFPFTEFDTGRVGQNTSETGHDAGSYFAENRRYAEGAAYSQTNMGRSGKPVVGAFFLRSDVQRTPGVESAIEYVATDPSQIKSADPLATDDSGNLITPEAWGDETSPDIRYGPDANIPGNNETGGRTSRGDSRAPAGGEDSLGISPQDNSPRAKAVREAAAAIDWANATPAERIKALASFSRRVASGFVQLPAGGNVSVSVTSKEGKRIGAEVVGVPDGRLLVEINTGPDTKNSNTQEWDNPEAAFAYAYDVMQEESIHALQHVIAFRQWKKAGSPGTFKKFSTEKQVNAFKEVLRQYNSLVAAGDTAAAGKIQKALVSSWNLYRDLNNPVNSVNELVDLFIGDERMAASLVPELTRQLAQLTRQDFTTETGWRKFYNMVKGWMQDAIDSLKAALPLARGGQLGPTIRQEISDLETLMKNFENGTVLKPLYSLAPNLNQRQREPVTGRERRGQAFGQPEIAQIHQRQSTAVAWQAAQAVFNAAETPVTPESRTTFLELMRTLLDPRLGPSLAQDLIEAGNDMAPVALQDEMATFALRAAAEGDVSLLNMFLNNVNRMSTGTDSDVSKSARELAMRRWAEATQLLGGLDGIKEERDKTAIKSGVKPAEMQALQDELDAAKVKIEELLKALESKKAKGSGKNGVEVVDAVGGKRKKPAKAKAVEDADKAKARLEKQKIAALQRLVDVWAGELGDPGSAMRDKVVSETTVLMHKFVRGEITEAELKQGLLKLKMPETLASEAVNVAKARVGANKDIKQYQKQLTPENTAQAIVDEISGRLADPEITEAFKNEGRAAINVVRELTKTYKGGSEEPLLRERLAELPIPADLQDELVKTLNANLEANKVIRSDAQPTQTAQAIVDAHVKRFMPSATAPQENRTKTRIEQALRMTAPTVTRQQVYDTLKQNLLNNGVAEPLADSVSKITADAWQVRRSAMIEEAVEKVSAKWLLQQVLKAPVEMQQSPNWRQDMMAQWLSLSGFTAREVELAVKVLDKPFGKALADAKLDAAERYAEQMRKVLGVSVNGRARLKKAVVPAIERVQNALRTGSFEGVSDEMAKWQGWKPLSAAELKRLNELDAQIKSSPSRPYPGATPPHFVLKATHEMFDIFKQHVSGSTLENMAIAFHLNLLSGLPTAGVNIIGPPMKVITEAAIDIARAGVTLDIARFQSIANALKTAASTYFKEGRFTAKYDISDRYGVTEITTTREIANLNYQLDKWLSGLKQAVKDRSPTGILKGVFGISDIVRRFLTVADTAGTAAVNAYSLIMGAHQMAKDAGVSTRNIRSMFTEARLEGQRAYSDAVMAGYSPEDADTAAIDARRAAILGGVYDFVSPEKAFLLDRMAKQEGFLAIGRKPVADDLNTDFKGNEITDRLGENLEGGLISRHLFGVAGMNDVLEAISAFKYGGNTPKAKALRTVLGTLMYGLVHVPYRASRHFASYSPYGFIRYGVKKLRDHQGKENWHMQSMGTPEQEQTALWRAAAGTALMALIASLFRGSDEPEEKDKDYITVTGNGPPTDDPQVRDAWIKQGNQPYHMRGRLFGVPFNVNIGRGGEVGLFAALPFAVADDLAIRDKIRGYKSKEYKASDIVDALSTYVAALASKGGVGGLIDLSGKHTSTLASGKGIASAVSGYAANVIPLNRFIQTTENLFINPPDKSTVETTITANIPLARLGNFPALNRMGDPVGDANWLGKISYMGVPLPIDVEPTEQNKKVYEVIHSKMAAPGRMNRVDVEKKYGELTNRQWYDFVKASGGYLSKRITDSHDKLMKMSPGQVDDWMADVDKVARVRAANAGGLRVVKVTKVETP